MTPSRIFLLLLLLPAALCAQSPPEFGAHFNYHTVFIHGPKAYFIHHFTAYLSSSRLYRPGVQAGFFLKTGTKKQIDFRAEANYSLMGYYFDFEKDMIDYHYLGTTALPSIRVSDRFRLGVGGFANFLIFNPGDADPAFEHRRIDAGVLASAFLRYDRIEIQARYQRSLTTFTPQGLKPNLYFGTLSVGLAYYFLTDF